MRHTLAIGILLAPLTIAGSAQPSPQNSAPGPWQNFLIPDGETVYDTVNHVTWLADANLAGKTLPDGTNFRFGLPLCDPLVAQPPGPCVNASGMMNYNSAKKWVKGMNDAEYLGHNDWQLPTTPSTDHSCSAKAPLGNDNNFGFGCKANALAYLYNTLGIMAPNTAVPIPPNTVGPFHNFPPSLYWGQLPSDATTGGVAVFSFATGAQGGSVEGDYQYVLPMIKGELLGVPLPSGSELHVNPDGKTVYDPGSDATWLVDANLAATWLAVGNLGVIDTLGFNPCETPTKPSPCVALDGSMNYESAKQFIDNMNTYDNGKGYLGQTNWQLPPVSAKCPTYGCGGLANPMGNLYYDQLKFTAGTPVVAFPDVELGPFNDIQPYHYWSCLADTIQDPCERKGSGPGAEFGFSFGDGYLGTARLLADHFVTLYYVGCDPHQSWCQTITFPRITAKDVLTSFALSATASSGLEVTFKSTTPTVCTVSGDTASLLIPGACTIEASQAGNDSFESALPIEQTFTVNHPN